MEVHPNAAGADRALDFSLPSATRPVPGKPFADRGNPGINPRGPGAPRRPPHAIPQPACSSAGDTHDLFAAFGPLRFKERRPCYQVGRLSHRHGDRSVNSEFPRDKPGTRLRAPCHSARKGAAAHEACRICFARTCPSRRWRTAGLFSPLQGLGGIYAFVQALFVSRAVLPMPP